MTSISGHTYHTLNLLALLLCIFTIMVSQAVHSEPLEKELACAYVAEEYYHASLMLISGAKTSDVEAETKLTANEAIWLVKRIEELEGKDNRVIPLYYRSIILEAKYRCLLVLETLEKSEDEIVIPEVSYELPFKKVLYDGTEGHKITYFV